MQIQQTATSNRFGLAGPRATRQAGEREAAMIKHSGTRRLVASEVAAALGTRLSSDNRRAAIGVAIALALGSLAAEATVVVNFADTVEGHPSTIKATSANYVTAYNTGYWTDYSKNCSNVVGGTTCSGLAGDMPAANPSEMLFSWGTDGSADISNSPNSVLEATYTGDIDTLRIKSVSLSSTQSGLGPAGGPYSATGTYDPGTGRGSMVVYEQPELQLTRPPSFASHLPTEQRVNIWVGDVGTGTLGAANQQVLTGAPAERYPVNLGGGAFEIQQFGFYSPDDPPVNPPVNPPVDPPAELPAATVNFTTPLQLNKDGKLSFQFFESNWNNATYTDRDIHFPDAYYSAMDLTFTLANPVIAVDDVDFGNVRAGTATVTTGGTMTVTNVAEAGDDPLNGQFDKITNAGPFGGASDAAAFSALVAGDPSSTATRDFTFSPGTLAEDETTGRVSSVTQTVSSLSATNSGAEGTVTGKTVGPLGRAFQVADNNGAITPVQRDPVAEGTDPTTTAPIELGSIAVDKELTNTWLMSNIFGDDISQALTSLTLLNVGFEDDPTNNDPVYGDRFRIEGFSANTIVDATKNSPDFDIVFESSIAGDFFALLQIRTDQEATLGFGKTGRVFSYYLKATATPSGNTPAPAPATLALFAVGLIALRLIKGGKRR